MQIAYLGARGLSALDANNSTAGAYFLNNVLATFISFLKSCFGIINTGE